MKLTIIKKQWETVELGTLANFRNGVNYNKDNFGRGIKVINVKDFQNHSIALFENLDEINPSGLIRQDNLLRDGDIIFVRSNGNRELIGRSMYISNIQEQVTHSAFTIRVRFTSAQALPRFYAYLFRSFMIRQTLSSHGNGTNISNLNQGILTHLRVPLPPLAVQRKIATILSTYDRLIENNTRRIKILEEMAQMLYREWFVHFRFPGHEQVKMVDSELGLIPEGWGVVNLGNIAQDIRRGVNPEQINPETPYFGLEHLPRKSIALSQWGTASQVQSTKLIFKKGEILFGKIRPYFHKVGVAPLDGVCSSDAIVISAKDSEHFPIVLAYVSSEDFVNYATQTSQGTKMPRANWDVLVKYPVLIPPLPLLYQFNEFVGSVVTQIHNMIFRNRNLSYTHNLLLPKLISGEIDVENVDINTIELAA